MPRPVVLVHGTRTSSAMWRREAADLRDRGHDVVTVDLPGHGRLGHERFAVARSLEVVRRAVRSLPAPPLLVGMSLGGYLSVAYAARHPGDVAGLVLAGCSTEIRGKPLAVFRQLAHHANLRLRLGGPTWHVVTDMLRELDRYSLLADLRRVDVPVWLVNGQRDPMRFDERRVLRAARHGELHVVPRAGHDVNLQAPAAFDAVVVRALRRLGAAVVRA